MSLTNTSLGRTMQKELSQLRSETDGVDPNLMKISGMK
jgi:hypothetical protein